MTWQLNGISINSLQWLVLKNQNFFFQTFCSVFSFWTIKATFCFQNFPEYFWLKSECLVSRCHLKSYSFLEHSVYLSDMWCYLYSQQNTTSLPFSLKIFCFLLTSAPLFYFCQLWIYLGSELFHTKHTPVIITPQLSTVVGYKHFSWNFFNNRTLSTEKLHSQDHSTHARMYTMYCANSFIQNWKLRATWDKWDVPLVGNKKRNTLMKNNTTGVGSSFCLKHQ